MDGLCTQIRTNPKKRSGMGLQSAVTWEASE